MAGPVRVFIACSLDGFIAGPDDDLSWLPGPPDGGDEDYGFATLLAESGAVLMGRNTYRVAAGFEGQWPYGELPVLVATTRPLPDPAAPTVEPIGGSPHELLAQVRELTDGGVYLDGGVLIRQFLDAGLVDELTVTIVPVILGAGSPLFAGAEQRHALELTGSHAFDSGLVQLRYRAARESPVDAKP